MRRRFAVPAAPVAYARQAGDDTTLAWRGVRGGVRVADPLFTQHPFAAPGAQPLHEAGALAQPALTFTRV